VLPRSVTVVDAVKGPPNWILFKVLVSNLSIYYAS
jgi:hypothetical protein